MKNLKKIVGIIVLLIVILIITFYFKSNSPEEHNNQANSDIQSEYNWQTYNNDKYGFEFKYPNDWYDREKIDENGNLFVCLNPKGTAGDCPGAVMVSHDIDLEEMYKRIKTTFEEYKIAESDITILNIPAKMFSVSGYEKGREGSTRILIFEHKELIYRIEMVYGKENIFTHILSTFKFTKSISADDDSSASKITKSTWGIVFDKLEGWETIRSNNEQVILSNSQDLITISHLVGPQVADSDTKFGSTTFSYDENVGAWTELILGETQPAENYQEFPNLKTGEPVFLGVSRWRTYIIPLSHNEFIKLNITGTGNIEPLDQLLKSIETI